MNTTNIMSDAEVGNQDSYVTTVPGKQQNQTTIKPGYYRFLCLIFSFFFFFICHDNIKFDTNPLMRDYFILSHHCKSVIFNFFILLIKRSSGGRFENEFSVKFNTFGPSMFYTFAFSHIWNTCPGHTHTHTPVL